MNQVELQAYANLDALTYPHRIYDIPYETPILVDAKPAWGSPGGRKWERGIVKRCRYNSRGTAVNDYYVAMETGYSGWFASGLVCIDRERCCLLTDKPGDLSFTGNAFSKSLYQAYRNRIIELKIEPEDQYVAGFRVKPEGLEVVILEHPDGAYYGHALLYIYKQNPCRLTIPGYEWQGFFKVASSRLGISAGTTSISNCSKEQITEELNKQVDWLTRKSMIIKRRTPKS